MQRIVIARELLGRLDERTAKDRPAPLASPMASRSSPSRNRNEPNGELDATLEYQGKELFAERASRCRKGKAASSVEEAVAIMRANPAPSVVKAQVLIGGRGKAGGIKFCSDARRRRRARESDPRHAHRQRARTRKARSPRAIWIEQRVDIAKELYLSITVDRASKRPIIMASAMGGMDVEEVARQASGGDREVSHRSVRSDIGRSSAAASRAKRTCPKRSANQVRAHRSASSTHCSSTSARCSSRSIRSRSRKTASSSLRTRRSSSTTTGCSATKSSPRGSPSGESDPLKERAIAAGLGENNYVQLDGDVGIIGNGAGLVMGTLDAVKHAGGEPANFLDVGGGAKADVMREAVNIVTSNPKVRSLFINIFGGITRGDEVAKGLIEALASGGWDRRTSSSSG